MSIMDDSGSTWVTAFNDQAEKLLGVTARDLFEMRSTDNQAGYEKVFADCLFKPVIAKVWDSAYIERWRFVVWIWREIANADFQSLG